MLCHVTSCDACLGRSPVDNAIRIEFNSPMHGDKYKEENIGPPSASTSKCSFS